MVRACRVCMSRTVAVQCLIILAIPGTDKHTLVFYYRVKVCF